MENLGDWIYFIVLAVIGLSSMFTGGKKKKNQQQTPPPPLYPEVYTEETPPSGDFWYELIEKEPQAPPAVAQNKEQPYTPSWKSSYQPPQESDIEKAIRAQRPSPIFEEETATPLVSADDFRDPESLRKAVIYTEILNRKY